MRATLPSTILAILQFRSILLCGLTLLCACANPVVADCNAIAEKAKTADPATLEALYREASQSADCHPDFRDYLGREVARYHLRQVQEQLKRDSKADVLAGLQKSLQYAPLWQAQAMLGDRYRDRGEFAEATVRYQDALNSIDDPRITPVAPDPAWIEKIFRKAESTRLLAPDFVPTPTRGGKPGGLAATSIRGWVPEQVAIPITFEYDSIQFDAKGKLAATEMLNYLQIQGSPAITLIGHTDPRGSDEYNLGLSRRRAETVKQFLLAERYPGDILTDGRGKREPRILDDATAYAEEELYRLHRRVQLKRR